VTAARYPEHLTKEVRLAGGDVITIRPIRPQDAAMEQAFVKALSDTSRYYRFMDAIRELPKPMLERFTHIDYEREMALIAITKHAGSELQIGVARYALNPGGKSCEFAIAVADAWHGKGVGSALMRELIAVARANGLESMEGIVLRSNQKMLQLAASLGFNVLPDAVDATLRRLEKALR
jgi:acetyltransferase